MAGDRRGAALMDAVAGLALLSLAGTAVLAVIASGQASEYRSARLEREIEEADRLLVGLTFLDRRDLDRRIGAQVHGGFLVVITRPAPTLYRIAVASTDAPDTDLLTTVVYRERVT